MISYGSRATNDVETRYSLTETEALAVVWGYERFHLYLFAKNQLKIISDHTGVHLQQLKSQNPQQGYADDAYSYHCTTLQFIINRRSVMQ